MSINKPEVSVILPVHRNDQFTKLSVESMLNQDFQDLEILLIKSNNFEFDESLNDYSKIRVLTTPNGWNLSQKLNYGIGESKGKYIARMDSDDVSYPNRISKQVQYMESNPRIDVLGTGIKFIGHLNGNEDLNEKIALLPSDNKDLLLRMINKNPFFHPTVMIRLSSLEKHGLRYRRKFNRSQDYDLWIRSAGKLNFANLQEPLLDYRLHSFQSGVLGAVDSNYFSDLAKLNYCLKCIISFDYRSLSAFRILPHRIRKLMGSWKQRSVKN